ncbi:MAG: thiamine pyrophosphate-dependent enzyme [Myxococcales bacterium]|nr:thiamine pyrophosphate-dependent enzyme [Myxococcales bacterium]
MPLDRFETLQQRLHHLADRGPGPGPARVPDDAVDMFTCQLVARHLDAVALRMRAAGTGYYTITSAGHEGNVVVGYRTRTTDPALLHYRSGALFAARAARSGGVDAIEAVVLGLAASSEDPIAGGRHKVFGNVSLGVLPQTSTIASQMPKAVGLSLCLDRARRIGHAPEIGGQPTPSDAITITSFGDGSLNHASATVALNAARWVAHQGLPLPLLFVCEDNGRGLSVRTPAGWTRRVLSELSPIAYFAAEGHDLAASDAAAQAAVAHCRQQRAPAILHLRCARLMGHSGADPDWAYRSSDELERALTDDPVLYSAALLLRAGLLTGTQLKALDEQLQAQVRAAADRAAGRPKLMTAQEVMEPMFQHRPQAVAREAERKDFAAETSTHGDLGEKPQPLGRLINRALHELMTKYPNALVFGEDVAEKGGVYNVTAGLWKRFGAGRVFNTLLDETTILALAQGAGAVGMLPVPEIQYLAFLHNAEDQLRGEAASTAFFSRGQLGAPMVVRIAGYGYQKGFGGHFHNDNSLAVLRDIPGILIASPSHGADAVRLLRTCFAAAHIDRRVVVFVEPIALYNERDLLRKGDGGMVAAFPPAGQAIAYGEVGTYGPKEADVLVVTYANGVRMARRVAASLDDVRVRVLDLRWLAPLPLEAVRAAAATARRVVVLDECRREGNVGEAIAADLACHAHPRPAIELVTAKSSFVPLADAAELVLPSQNDLRAAIEASL